MKLHQTFLLHFSNKLTVDPVSVLGKKSIWSIFIYQVDCWDLRFKSYLLPAMKDYLSHHTLVLNLSGPCFAMGEVEINSNSSWERNLQMAGNTPALIFLSYSK